ncbi:MAG: hypothetical protein KJO98_03770 [Rhodothermia bacterium]|nr:hypothetical protein [Rhodothermia bacterium]
MFRIVLPVLLTAALSTLSCAPEKVEAESAVSISRSAAMKYRDESQPRIRSVTFSSRREPEPGTLDELRHLGISHVTLVTFGYQRGITDTTIRFDPDRRWYTESDRGIQAIAEGAREHGVGTILKPHIWVGGYDTAGQRRDMIGFDTEAKWTAWESSYRTFILHYARLARNIDADVFVIGTELATAARERPDFWRRMANEIRAEYNGSITYAANWYAEYEDVDFWPALDLIGIQAYFPVSSDDRPSLTDLRGGWLPHKQSLSRIADIHNKPVFFTEIGYRSVVGSAREPWQWVSRKDVGVVETDLQLQADLFTAFFLEVWNEQWFAGASIWRWHTAAESAGPRRAIDFTPQRKPSLRVIREWFAKDMQSGNAQDSAPSTSRTN